MVDLTLSFALTESDPIFVTASSPPPDDLLSVVAIAVVVMLTGFALEWLRTLVSTVLQLARLVLTAAIRALVLSAASAVLLVAVLILMAVK